MEIIDQIKQTADIVDIASQYTTLIKRGKNHVGLCPFHSEKTPSFTLDVDRQLFHCFGCGAGGDIFTLVMEKENLSFPEAMKFLADKYKIAIPERKKLSPQLLKLEENLYNIIETTLAFFRKNLFNTQEGKDALAYLHKRNISDEVIQTLKIGYALNSWDSLLGYFKTKNISPSLLEKAGLVLQRQKKEGFYDRFRGRIIFPIFTGTGKPVAFGGRTLFDADPKYLNSPDTPIYTKGKILYGLNFSKDDIRSAGEVYLVEGYTDFLSLYQAGIKNCAASLGTSLTADQAALAFRFAHRVISSYDGDTAGKKAALRAISLCFELGVHIRILTLPQGSDPDSFIRQFGPDQFQVLGQKSVPGLKYLIDSLTGGKRKYSPEDKSRIINSILREIVKISDSIVRSEYLKQASEYLSVDESLLRSLISSKHDRSSSTPSSNFLPAEKRLLQIIFEDTQLAIKVFDILSEKDFQGLKSEQIFSTLMDFIKNGKSLSVHQFKEKIDPELFRPLSEILIEGGQPFSIEEAIDCIEALKKHSLKKQQEELRAELTRLENRGEKDKLPLLLKKIQEITQELSTYSLQNCRKDVKIERGVKIDRG
jgi:DNA primase